METVWKGRLTQAAAKYGEVAPNAAVCCNACRTCVQSNIAGLALAAAAAAGGLVTRRLRRVTRRS